MREFASTIGVSISHRRPRLIVRLRAALQSSFRKPEKYQLCRSRAGVDIFAERQWRSEQQRRERITGGCASNPKNGRNTVKVHFIISRIPAFPSCLQGVAAAKPHEVINQLVLLDRKLPSLLDRGSQRTVASPELEPGKGPLIHSGEADLLRVIRPRPLLKESANSG